MTEADRIRAMRDEGKIDDAQAERLLAAVEAIAAAEAEASAAPQRTSPQTAPTPPTPPTPPSGVTPSTPPAAPIAPTPTPGSTAAGSTAADTPTPGSATPDAMPDVDVSGDVDRWLHVDLFAGSLDVRVDAGAGQPTVTSSRGDVTVEATSDGWKVEHGQDDRGTWLERLVSGVKDARVDVVVPARTGVRLNVKAGDVDLHGVPALRGRLMAGDLDADGLRAVDLTVKAGDVDLDLDPLPGRHTVSLAAGDLTVKLPEHADATVDGSVTVGDADGFAPLVAERKGMIAGQVHGVLGQGRARLELKVGTGDLDVERSRRHGS